MKRLIVICAVAGLILAAGSMAQAVPTTTVWMNPTDDINNPGNFGFNTPTGAYTDGMGPDGWSSAMAMPGSFNVHQFYGYGFSVPAGATINGIEVRMDVWRSIYADTGSMAVELSWNGGTNWTAMGYGTGSLNFGETIYYKGGASDTWGGHTWTADEINTNNFRVRQTATVTGDQHTAPRVYLDWVPVRVTYTPAPEPATICLLGLGALSLLRRKK